MTGNIIGEEFKPYVNKQIQSRQLKHGSGLSSNRSVEDINYLSNRNAWIKMASSVSIEEKQRLTNLDSSISEEFMTMGLARKAVLFNALTSQNFEFNKDDNKDLSGKFISYNQRYGIGDGSVWNESAYGLGGTNFGLQPLPGITSISIDTVNRGSIRKATVTLKAYNKFQFELIELLYLRLGFTMMLEWGWDKYLNDKTSKVEPIRNTIIEDWWFAKNEKFVSQLDVLSKIEEMREIYCGNYDGFFGKVSNYNWHFNSDGSYDISINLITLGDVIESLQVRVAATSNFLPTDSDNPIASSMGQTTIEQWLFNKISNENNFQPKSDYIQIGMVAVHDDEEENDPNAAPYKYYVSFNEFIRQLTQLCVPVIKNGNKKEPQLYFDNYINEILVKLFPNQIAIDPRVCLFNPYLSKKDFKEIKSDMSNNLKQYVIDYKQNGIMYGQLMNLYLNFDFIIQTLKSTTGDGKLSLYKFLENICNGLNSAMGGVNKIQPIIKDDNYITFIDQALQSSSNLRNENDKALIEVYGYNMGDKKNPGITSNFVKKIDFETKLSKETSTMISIGATAVNNETSIKNGDATAFYKWNEGLVDRFNQQITDPSEEALEITQAVKEQTSFGIDLKPKYGIQMGLKYYGVSYIGNKDFNQLNWIQITTYVEEYMKKDPVFPLASNETKIAYDITQLELAERAEIAKKAVQSTESFKTNSLTGYIAYLIDTFGGTSAEKVSGDEGVINYTNPESAQCFSFNPQFIDKGKTLYKAYISAKALQKYNEVKEQSSQIGFLPLEFTLTTDGISGMKIYNKLNISQDFLPKNYPKSFDFIVTKLNHKVDQSGWDTEIGTLSTSNIDDKLDEGGNDNLIVTAESPCGTKYPELKIIPIPAKDIFPIKTIASYLKKNHPQNGKAVFAIMMAESAKHGPSNFSSAGGNNFAGVQTDAGRWGGNPKFSGQFCRRDSSKRSRMFASFDTVNDFLDFMVDRVKNKGFKPNQTADEWTLLYIRTWWSPFGKEKMIKGTPDYNNKLLIYKSAEKTYNQS